MSGCAKLPFFNKGSFIPISYKALFEFAYKIVSSEANEGYKKQYIRNLQEKNNSKANYYYKQLSEDGQACYDFVVDGCKNYKSEISIMPIEEDEFYKAQSAVMYDHPEFFWITPFKINKSDGIVNTVYFEVPDDAEETSKKIDKIAKEVVAESPNQVYDEVKYFYDYIIDNVEYGNVENLDQDIRSVFLKHKSVCAGYSKAFKYLCDKAGLECAYIQGRATQSDEAHAWNAVKINNHWYWVDCTWGDPIYLSEPKTSSTNYEYLLASDEILNETHKASGTPSFAVHKSDDEVFKMPVCDDNSYYYYSRMGSYFRSYDEKAIEEHIAKCVRDNTKITMKFKHQKDYDKAFKHFIEDKEVENILHKYYKNKKLRYYITHSKSIRALEIKIEFSRKESLNPTRFSCGMDAF